MMGFGQCCGSCGSGGGVYNVMKIDPSNGSIIWTSLAVGTSPGAKRAFRVLPLTGTNDVMVSCDVNAICRMDSTGAEIWHYDDQFSDPARRTFSVDTSLGRIIGLNVYPANFSFSQGFYSIDFSGVIDWKMSYTGSVAINNVMSVVAAGGIAIFCTNETFGQYFGVATATIPQLFTNSVTTLYSTPTPGIFAYCCFDGSGNAVATNATVVPSTGVGTFFSPATNNLNIQSGGGKFSANSPNAISAPPLFRGGSSLPLLSGTGPGAIGTSTTNPTVSDTCCDSAQYYFVTSPMAGLGNIIALDSSFNLVWSQTYGPTSSHNPTGCCISDDGYLYVCGN